MIKFIYFLKTHVDMMAINGIVDIEIIAHWIP
jgi:hypothetical protein